jgi:hypothetical protein
MSMNTVTHEVITGALTPDEHTEAWSDDLRDVAVVRSHYEGIGFAWQGVTLHNAHGSCYRRYRWEADRHPTVSRDHALGLLAADRLHREYAEARVLVHRCHCLGRGDDRG